MPNYITYEDRVKETTTTTGTSDITLAGAATGYRAFDTAIGQGPRFPYVIAGTTEWETGYGYLSGASTLVRETVLRSTNSNALVNFSAGSKDVFCDVLGDFLTDVRTLGKTLAANRGQEMF